MLAELIIRLEEGEPKYDPDSVTPGWEGFAFTGVFVVAVIVLGVFLVRTIRRINVRAQVREEIARELAEQQTPQNSQGSSGDAPSDSDDGDDPDGADGRPTENSPE
jgi:hypothetical protein